MLKRLLFSLGIFAICRFIFLLFYWSELSSNGVFELAKAFVLGLRFDVFASFYINVIFFLILFVPFRYHENRIIQGVLKFSFVLSHALVLILNLSDIVYFKFSGRRIAYDFISFIQTGDEAGNVALDFLLDNWFLSVFFLVLMPLIWKGYPKFSEGGRKSFGKYRYGKQLFGALLAFLIFFLGIRGGWQYKPIKIINAGFWTKQEMIPLVLNNPFCLISTWKKTELQGRKYYQESELENYIQHQKKNVTSDEHSKPNVVLLIMESFTREYIGYYNGYGYTPFLDSLLGESLVYKQAFANGTRSIESLPSLFASIPGLFTEAYITSSYGGNKIRALPHYLNELGYSTSFFHGGATGTMGFDGFCKASGIQKYYGKEDYPNPEHDDGEWGIYDDKFFPFFLEKMNQEEKPFFYTMFSLSSHHPYKIPEEYQNRFPKGELEIHESIGYADEVLRQFFAAAKKQDWYDNTLFIITADHAFYAVSNYYMTALGRYRIPMALFHPSDSTFKGDTDRIVQQIDIMPTVMDYVNDTSEYIAFGNSVFGDTQDAYAINYINGFYQYIKDDTLYQFDGDKMIGIYAETTDHLLEHNLLDLVPSSQYNLRLDTLKAIIQDYESRLINNNLIPEEKH